MTPAPAPTTPPPGGLLLFSRNPDPWEPYGYVWVMAADGTGRRTLGKGVEASWSADGRRVHLVAPDTDCTPSLITEAADGSNRVVVTHGLRSLDYSFAWSPDDRQIAFIRYRNTPPRMCGSQGGTYSAEELISDVVLMDADGGGQRVLVTKVWPLGERPLAWSPDGRQLALSSGNPPGLSSGRLVLARVSDGAQTVLPATVGSDVVEAISWPSWSPDGAHLGFSYWNEGGRRVGVTAADGSDRRSIGPGAVSSSNLSGPGWSPDGTTLAVAGDLVDPAGVIRADLALLQADGSSERHLGLTDVGMFSGVPTWSPDGRWLAYVSQVTDANGTHPGPIIEISADGSTRREVPGTGPTGASDFARWVAWQPHR